MLLWRGVDVSSVLNWIIAQNLHVLVRLQAQRDAALAIAKTEGLANAVTELLQRIELEDGPDAASRRLEDLLASLRRVEAERQARAPDNDRPASKAG